MTARDTRGRFRKGGATSLAFTFKIIHPDFSRAKFDRSKTRRIITVVARIIVEGVLYQIPIDTGQLRASYRRMANLGLIRPGQESRGSITNKILADILASKGLLKLYISPALKKRAIKVGERVAFQGSSPIKFSGARITLE